MHKKKANNHSLSAKIQKVVFKKLFKKLLELEMEIATKQK